MEPSEVLAPGKPDSVYAEMARETGRVERVGRQIAARLVREGLSRHEAQAAIGFARSILDCWFDHKARGNSHV